jgi:hypothetical protein
VYSRFFGPTFPDPEGATGAIGRGVALVGAVPTAATGAVEALLTDVGLGSATFAEGSPLAGFSAGAGSGAALGAGSRGGGETLGDGSASPTPADGGGGPPLAARMITLTTPIAAAAMTAREWRRIQGG